MNLSKDALKELYLDQIQQILEIFHGIAANNPALDNKLAVIIETLNQSVQPLFAAQQGLNASIDEGLR